MKKGTMAKLYVPSLLQDPFHNNMTLGEVTLELPCMGGRKGRDGLFPASDCIKVTGYYGEGQTFPPACFPRRLLRTLHSVYSTVTSVCSLVDNVHLITANPI